MGTGSQGDHAPVLQNAVAARMSAASPPFFVSPVSGVRHQDHQADLKNR